MRARTVWSGVVLLATLLGGAGAARGDKALWLQSFGSDAIGDLVPGGRPYMAVIGAGPREAELADAAAVLRTTLCTGGEGCWRIDIEAPDGAEILDDADLIRALRRAPVDAFAIVRVSRLADGRPEARIVVARRGGPPLGWWTAVAGEPLRRWLRRPDGRLVDATTIDAAAVAAMIHFARPAGTGALDELGPYQGTGAERRTLTSEQLFTQLGRDDLARAARRRASLRRNLTISGSVLAVVGLSAVLGTSLALQYYLAGSPPGIAAVSAGGVLLLGGTGCLIGAASTARDPVDAATALRLTEEWNARLLDGAAAPRAAPGASIPSLSLLPQLLPGGGTLTLALRF